MNSKMNCSEWPGDSQLFLIKTSKKAYTVIKKRLNKSYSGEKQEIGSEACVLYNMFLQHFIPPLHFYYLASPSFLFCALGASFNRGWGWGVKGAGDIKRMGKNIIFI